MPDYQRRWPLYEGVVDIGFVLHSPQQLIGERIVGDLMSVVSYPSKSKMGTGPIVHNWTSSELLE